jgi:uncharacterized membrane protein
MSERADVLVVAVFESGESAWNALVDARVAAASGRFELCDACVVARNDDGSVHVRESSDVTDKEGGGYGALWGLLGGALIGVPVVGAAAGVALGVYAARRRDFGITDAFEQRVAERLQPGKAAAVALVPGTIADDLERAAVARGAWATTVVLDVADA